MEAPRINYAAAADGVRVAWCELGQGEPIEERGDLFGTAVIRAARVMAAADGGEILVTQVVADLVEGKPYLFSDRGEAALKGFECPVRLFELNWRRA